MMSSCPVDGGSKEPAYTATLPPLWLEGLPVDNALDGGMGDRGLVGLDDTCEAESALASGRPVRLLSGLKQEALKVIASIRRLPRDAAMATAGKMWGQSSGGARRRGEDKREHDAIPQESE